MPFARLYDEFEAFSECIESLESETDLTAVTVGYRHIIDLWVRLLAEPIPFLDGSVPSAHRHTLLGECSLAAVRVVRFVGEATEPRSAQRIAAKKATRAGIDKLRPLAQGAPLVPVGSFDGVYLTYHLLAGLWFALHSEDTASGAPETADAYLHASMRELNLAAAASQVSAEVGCGELTVDNVWDRVLFAQWATAALANVALASREATERIRCRHATESSSPSRFRCDLSLLVQAASRASTLMETLPSDRHADTVFERQLALLMTSLGFVTVPAQRATRGVDLICIGHPANRHEFKFLLEAKSTKGRYSLPTADERAIRDYVKHVRERIDVPDTLKFMLIVSSRPSQTLEAKLKRLQSTIGLPLRYANARGLAGLRRELPAQAPMSELLECFIGSASCVLGDEFWRPAAARYAEVATQRTDLTSLLLGQLGTDAAVLGDESEGCVSGATVRSRKKSQPT